MSVIQIGPNLIPVNNLSDVESASESRSNLGLTDSAILPPTTWLEDALNLSDLTNPATARTNLGLGTVAVENVVPIAKGGTNHTTYTSGLMPYFDGTRIIDSGVLWDSATNRIFVNFATSIGGSNAGIQYSDASTANRGQIKLHSYFNGASIAGVATLTSRSGVIGTNAAVVAGQEYSKWTAQAGATTPGSAPISGNWAFLANTVNSLTVASDYRIQLTNLAGTLGTRLTLGSEGALQLPNYTTGIAHFDSSGNVTSSPASLTADVSGTLPIANGGTNNSSAYTAGSVIFSNGTSLTQDNSNLFFDDTNNRLGVGTSTPTVSIHSAGNTQTAILAETAATSSNAVLSLRRSRGTISSPTAVQSSDSLGVLAFNGHNGTAYQTTAPALIGATTSENFTTGAAGSNLFFSTTGSGSLNRKTRMIIAQDGAVQLLGDSAGTLSLYPAATTTSYSFTMPSAQGASNTLLKNDGTGSGSWSKVALTTDVSGVLPLANGGSNKALTASNGSIVYSDADSMEMSSVGNANQILLSGGAGAPSWGSREITGTATTMFATTGNDGDVFINTTYKHKFVWFQDRWIPQGMPNPIYGGVRFDEMDCATVNGDLGWASTGTFFNNIGEATHPGIFQIRTNAALTRSSIQLRGDSILLGTMDTYWEFSARVQTLSAAAQEFVGTLGLNDNPNFNALGDAVDGVYFSYDRLTNGNFWVLKTASNSVITTTVTATAVTAGVFVRLGCLIRDGTSAEFFIDGVSVGTHTTNIPTGTGRETGFQVKQDRNVGVANRNIDIDYFYNWYFFNGARA